MQPQCQIVFCSLQISELAIPSFPSNSSKQLAALCRETYSIHEEVLQSSASFVMHFECALATPRIRALPIVFARYKFYLDALAGRAPVVSWKDTSALFLRRSLPKIGASPDKSGAKKARWGVVQLVGHLTVNEDGEGSNPSAPANSFRARVLPGSANPALPANPHPASPSIRRPSIRRCCSPFSADSPPPVRSGILRHNTG